MASMIAATVIAAGVVAIVVPVVTWAKEEAETRTPIVGIPVIPVVWVVVRIGIVRRSIGVVGTRSRVAIPRRRRSRLWRRRLLRRLSLCIIRSGHCMESFRCVVGVNRRGSRKLEAQQRFRID